jgi:hypothetical protein
MYPGYEQYWSAVRTNPEGPLPFSGKTATKGEIAYASFAARTPHVVLSRTLDKVTWKNTQIVRDIEEVGRMKQQAGKDMHAVGGATLVCSLINVGLVDELRVVVHPILLGGGKALFKDVKERHSLKFLGAPLGTTWSVGYGMGRRPAVIGSKLWSPGGRSGGCRCGCSGCGGNLAPALVGRASPRATAAATSRRARCCDGSDRSTPRRLLATATGLVSGPLWKASTRQERPPEPASA